MRTAERHLTADINVTPFLDVLLVLIITFLASVSARKTMDAQLPLPCAGSCFSDDRPIVLEVLADGFLLNRQPVTAANLRETLRSAFNGRPEKVIQIAGHRETTYQNVLSAMDVARSAGITVISIPPIDSYSAK